MIRTEESGDHDEEVEWHQSEGDREPPLQDDTFVPHVKALTTRKDAPCVARLGNCCQHEGTEVPAALELILDR